MQIYDLTLVVQTEKFSPKTALRGYANLILPVVLIFGS